MAAVRGGVAGAHDRDGGAHDDSCDGALGQALAGHVQLVGGEVQVGDVHVVQLRRRRAVRRRNVRHVLERQGHGLIHFPLHVLVRHVPRAAAAAPAALDPHRPAAH